MQCLVAEAHVRTMQLMPPPIPFYIKGSDNIVADALSRMEADFQVKIPSADSLTEMSNAFSKEKDESFPMSPKLIEKCQKTDKSLAKNSLVTTLLHIQYKWLKEWS